MDWSPPRTMERASPRMVVPLPSPSSSGVEERVLGLTAQGPNNPSIIHSLPLKPFFLFLVSQDSLFWTFIIFSVMLACLHLILKPPFSHGVLPGPRTGAQGMFFFSSAPLRLDRFPTRSLRSTLPFQPLLGLGEATETWKNRDKRNQCVPTPPGRLKLLLYH